ncbi:MAG: hypothetical protein AB7F35_01925 [Acetobacteraceae bacterium]
MNAAGATATMLARHGETVVLRRPTGQGQFVDVPCAARVNQFQPHEITGGVMQGDREVILSNREIEAGAWPGPPRRGDQIVIAGRTTTVQGVETVSVGGQVVRHNLQVRGG